MCTCENTNMCEWGFQIHIGKTKPQSVGENSLNQTLYLINVKLNTETLPFSSILFILFLLTTFLYGCNLGANFEAYIKLRKIILKQGR